MGATEAGWWQFWQLRWRMGAMSFEKVALPAAGVAVSAANAVRDAANSAPVMRASRTKVFAVFFI
jgi:hypothetical protein